MGFVHKTVDKCHIYVDCQKNCKKCLQVGSGGLYDGFSGKQRDTSQGFPNKTKSHKIL